MKSYQIPKSDKEAEERRWNEARAKAKEHGADNGASHREDRLQMEAGELDRMLDHGTEYTITYTRGGIFGRKRSRRRTYTINEPTLAVLDEISRISVELRIDEEGIGKGGYDTIRASKQAVTDNARKMAKIVAIATLGEGIYDTIAGRSRYNRRRVDKLAHLIYHTTRPSQLMQLATTVTRQSNLGSFVSSTRLMSAARTTTPRTELVE